MSRLYGGLLAPPAPPRPQLPRPFAASRTGGLAALAARRRAELDDEEQDSLIRDLGLGALNTVGYVGGALDKFLGGRTARAAVDLATGGDTPATELLSVLPGTDLIGLTREQDQATGRDLNARLFGVDPVQTQIPGAGFTAGLATEIALDPATYLTFGASALTKGGRVAKAAGLLDDAARVAKGRNMARKVGDALVAPTQRFARRNLTLDDLIQGAADPAAARELAEQAAGGTDELTAILGQGHALQGRLGVGLPFSRPAAVLGSQTGSSRFGRGLDAAGVGLRSSPLGVGFRQAFGRETLDTGTVIGQEVASEAYPAFRRAAVAANEAVEDAMVQLGRVEQDFGMTPQDVRRLFVRTGEGVAPHKTFDPKAVGQVRTVANQVRTSLENAYQAADAAGVSVHRLVDPAGTRYLTRRSNTAKAFANATLRSVFKPFDTRSKAMIARKWFLKGIPEGTDGIEQIVANPTFKAAFRDSGAIDAINDLSLKSDLSTAAARAESIDRVNRVAARYGQPRLPADATAEEITNVSRRLSRGVMRTIRPQIQELSTKYLGRDARTVAGLRQQERALTEEIKGGLLTADKLAAKQKELKAVTRQIQQPFRIARWIGKDLNPKAFEEGMFQPPLRSVQQYMADLGRSTVAANSVMRFLGRQAIPKGADAAGESAANVLGAAKAFQGSGGQASKKALERLAEEVAGAQGITTEAALQRLKLGKLVIPKDIAKDARRMMQVASPGDQNPVVEFLQKVTNQFRFGVTAPFPAFHTRNRYFGLAMNWIGNAFDPRYSAGNPMRYLRPIMDAIALRTGKVVRNAAEIPELSRVAGRRLSDEDATQVLGELIHRYNLSFSRTEEASQLAGADPSAYLDQLFGPGRRASTITGAARRTYGSPLAAAVQGKPGQAFDQFKQGARELGGVVEFDNKASAFIGYLRQGWSAEAAAKEVYALHADYATSRFTRFENQYLRGRAVPFYSFSRQIIPTLVDDLIQRPGGKLAQSFRASGRLSADQVLPPYMQQGTNIDLGEGEEDSRRYLSGIDLPHELLGDYVRIGPNIQQTLQGTGQSLLSQLNPLVKLPLEELTGRNFFTGRELQDETPSIAWTLANVEKRLGNEEARPRDYGPLTNDLLRIGDRVAQASPLSRVYGTARRAIDTRKTPLDNLASLLGGVRVSDVDPSVERSRLASGALADLLRPNPAVRSFEKIYVKPEDEEDLDPTTANALRLLRAIESSRRER